MKLFKIKRYNSLISISSGHSDLKTPKTDLTLLMAVISGMEKSIMNS